MIYIYGNLIPKSITVNLKKNLHVCKLWPSRLSSQDGEVHACPAFFFSSYTTGFIIMVVFCLVFLNPLQFLPRLHLKRNSLLAENRLHHFSAKWKETQNQQFLGVLVKGTLSFAPRKEFARDELIRNAKLIRK